MPNTTSLYTKTFCCHILLTQHVDAVTATPSVQLLNVIMMELWGIVKLTGCTIRINAEILKTFFFFAKIMVQLVFLPSKYLFPKQHISPNTGHMVWTFMDPTE